MRSHFNHEIRFIAYRRVMFAISIVLVVLSLAGILFRGLNFGIEFLGGTQVTFNSVGETTIAQMRDAFSAQGVSDAVVQTSTTNGVDGFMVRTAETDPLAASTLADAVATSLGFEQGSYQTQTIGPNWGGDVTRSMVIAFFTVIALIIVYVSIRYEFKMSLMAVVSLVHVLVIVAGIYAWTHLEVTPNVVAALLTIMGYCLYDTVVVFNRVNENIRTLKDGVHRTALQITNFSENQVIIRSINTGLTSIVPVVVMLIFGGDTLKGFAFAMFIGLALGAYSSIAIASPLYALWKGREATWRAAEEKYGEKAVAAAAASARAEVPATPTAAADAASDQAVDGAAPAPAAPAHAAAAQKKPKSKKNKVR